MTDTADTSSPRLIKFGEPAVERVAKDVSEITVEGNPEQGAWLYSDHGPSASRAGIWECAAGKFRAKMEGLTEFCHVLEGEAHITNLADNTVTTVRAGDSFVMEAGYDTEWHVPNYIRKCFVLSDVKG